jgi:CBS domain-containing protein
MPGKHLNHEQRIHFRNDIRAARLATLRDAEDFSDVAFALERLGSWCCGHEGDLGKYLQYLEPLVDEADRNEFRRLYEHLRDARNSALHQGAFARNVAQLAVWVAILLEDGLTQSSRYLEDFMVTSPICAYPWQRVGDARRQVLAGSFSFLPVETKKWMLLGDYELAAFLRSSEEDRKTRRDMTIREARRNGLELSEVLTLPPKTAVEEALQKMRDRGGAPVLVTGGEGNLLGIVTAFDLL